MARILVDLDVILDVLLDRPPHAEASSALWAAIERGQAEGLLAAHGVTTLHYLATRAKGRDFADQCVTDVMSVFAVAPVDGPIVQTALAMSGSDFEDAVCAASAKAAGCHLIATRDPPGFVRAGLPAMSPTAALAMIRSTP